MEHRPIAEADLDPDAVKIIRRLTRFDHAAYLVGGCVRDLLLDRRPKDFDIGTSATPRQIKRLFRNCRIIGRRFRLAHVYFQNGKIIEVATFRAQDGDGPPGDEGGGDLLIRDDNQFGTLEEDALRRDFTINCLFYDVNEGNVLDHADGLGDLRRRLVRTIGDTTIRFREDPIRILRAIRFAARLGFDIEPATRKALRATREQIPRAAPPRTLEEINRLCRRGAAKRSFELLRETEVFRTVFPELERHYAGRSESWDLLWALLDRIDRQWEEDQTVVGTGQILAVLLLPALAERIGWRTDGTVQRLEDTDVRGVVDEVLRPIAVRLRVARKDQEHCRQVLSVLARLVPLRSMRRNSRRSLLRRACLPDALAMLRAAAGLYGGDFAAAFNHWDRAARSRAGEVRPDARPEAPAEESRPRRRRSRGGRGRGGKRPGERGPRARAAGGRPGRDGTGRRRPPAAAEGKPPVWDDDYFFAALPVVPEGSSEDPVETRGDAAAGRTEGDSREADRDGGPEAGEAKRRRGRSRRRSRRRRRSGSSGGDSDEQVS